MQVRMAKYQAAMEAEGNKETAWSKYIRFINYQKNLVNFLKRSKKCMGGIYQIQKTQFTFKKLTFIFIC